MLVTSMEFPDRSQITEGGRCGLSRACLSFVNLADRFDGKNRGCKVQGSDHSLECIDGTRMNVYRPVPRKTAPNVRNKILMSSQRLQFSTYAVSSAM